MTPAINFRDALARAISHGWGYGHGDTIAAYLTHPNSRGALCIFRGTGEAVYLPF